VPFYSTAAIAATLAIAAAVSERRSEYKRPRADKPDVVR
jgi:hypothetical protein